MLLVIAPTLDFLDYVLALRFGGANSELLGIIIGDVSVPPDVEMMLLGTLHGIIVFLHHLGKLPASLPVNQEETILNKSLSNIFITNMNGDKNFISSPEL